MLEKYKKLSLDERKKIFHQWYEDRYGRITTWDNSSPTAILDAMNRIVEEAKDHAISNLAQDQKEFDQKRCDLGLPPLGTKRSAKEQQINKTEEDTAEMRKALPHSGSDYEVWTYDGKKEFRHILSTKDDADLFKCLYEHIKAHQGKSIYIYWGKSKSWSDAQDPNVRYLTYHLTPDGNVITSAHDLADIALDKNFSIDHPNAINLEAYSTQTNWNINI